MAYESVTTTESLLPIENLFIVDASSSYGALLAGSFLSSAIWGVSSLQTFIYYVNYEDDPLWTRILIGVLWILDATNQILLLKSNWPVLVLQYGRIAGLSEIQPELMHHTYFQALIVFAVQIYFIRRIYLFYRTTNAHTWVKALIGFIVCLVILSSWQLVGIITYMILGYGHGLSFLASHLEMAIAMSLRATAIAVDVTVAICMMYLLNRQGPAHFTRSKQMIRRLLFVVICSGSLTAFAVTMVLILMAKYPNTLHYCIFEYTLGSLYFSTLLANLNSRDYVKEIDKGGVNTFSGFNSSRDVGPNNNTIFLERMGKQSSSGTTQAPAPEIPVKFQTERDGLDNIETFEFKV